MKVKKAIKRIAAAGVGATMMGATLMGAMAVDLSEYPNMFIKDGQFEGILVVGKNANAIDTIGVTNIALGLQKAAVTKTVVCGGATSSTTTVSGEQVQVDKTGDDLNIGEDLEDIQDVALDDGDLPSILADGSYDEGEGNTDNDVTYTQEIELLDGAGQIVYDQDDSDAPDAGVYLKFPKNTDVYNFTLEFDDSVEYDAATGTTAAADLESTTLELQGQKYTLTDVDFAGVDDAKTVDKITLMVGESVLWIQEGEIVTKEVDGVEHTVKMVDVANDADSCGFEVDGSTVWIDVDDTETVSGVTLGVTEAREVNVKDNDADICKVFIGAAELVLEDGKEVEMAGDDVSGSLVDITTAASSGDGTWDKVVINYDPDDDIYLAAGDEWVDPVFGNFKFIMGGEIASNEDLVLEASGGDATLTFINYDDEEVEVPWAMEDDADFEMGEDPDLGANSDEGFYLEGATCDPDSGDVTDCVGARFLAVTTGSVAHVIELASIDDPGNTDPEIDFDDLTYGTSTDNNDYDNDGTAQSFDLGSGVGAVTLTISNDQIVFTNIQKGDIKTSNDGILDLNYTYLDDTNGAELAWFSFDENDDESNNLLLNFTLGQGTSSDTDKIEIQAPVKISGTPTFAAAVDFSDSDDDNQMYYTTWGSIIKYNSDDKDKLEIVHPEEQLNVEVFVAETGAQTTTTEGAGEGCTTSETINPIPSTANKFDTEVSNPGAQNLLAIGVFNFFG